MGGRDGGCKSTQNPYRILKKDVLALEDRGEQLALACQLACYP